MTQRGTLEAVKVKGTVQNGVVAVDLPDGTPVTIVVEGDPLDSGPPEVPVIRFDDTGELIMTPELERELAIAEAEARRGEGIPWSDLRLRLRRLRGL